MGTRKRIVNLASKSWPALVLAAVLAGCAGPGVIVQPGTPPRLYAARPVSVLTGKASYYWDPQPTANGERFNPEAMTAAHKSLPFDTMVRVVNLRNHRSTIVRINDRGPYIRGRIIDLSRAAAREIDMVRAGVVPVRVEVLKPIGVVGKPNLKVTPRIRQDAELRLREAEKKKKTKTEVVEQTPPDPEDPEDLAQKVRKRRTR